MYLIWPRLYNISVTTHTYSCGHKILMGGLGEGCHDSGVKSIGIKAETCICTGNLCNAAPTKGISGMLAISCIMMALFKVAT